MRIPKSGPQNDVVTLRRSNRLKSKKMDTTTSTNNSSSSSSGSSDGKEEKEERKRLSKVVSECGRRWFHDALREANSGDVAMQVLVSQMYYHGYGGLPKDSHKAIYWRSRASNGRSSLWSLGRKRPGYQASDTDSESEGNSSQDIFRNLS